MKVISFSQQGPRAICILSANGVISNVTLRQHDSLGGTVTYEVCSLSCKPVIFLYLVPCCCVHVFTYELMNPMIEFSSYLVSTISYLFTNYTFTLMCLYVFVPLK